MTYTASELGIRSTPTDWLGVGQSIGDLANRWADRGDILAYVGPGAGSGAPACFNHTTGELEIDVEKAFGPVEPKSIGPLTDRSVRYEFPRATGLIAHEAFHARFTLYDKRDLVDELTPSEMDALIMLEESRIESHGIVYEPQTRAFLRVAVHELLGMNALESLDSVQGASSVVALVGGRVQSGVLSHSEVSGVLDMAKNILGEGLYNDLTSIVRRAQAHYYHRNPADLVQMAKDWVELVRQVHGSEPGSHGSERKLIEELEQAMDSLAVKAMGELMDQETGEDWAETTQAMGESRKEKRSNEAIADEVFAKGTAHSEPRNTNSQLIETRPAKQAERVAAVTIAKELEKAKYHDRIEIETNQVAPPGRLNTRSMVQATALKAKGVRATVEPWKRVTRKHTVDPSLTVGVMVDISGSMNDAMEPMATTAWVMSEATRRVQGKTAMVYFGNDVFPTLKPGEHLKEVRVYSAMDGVHHFDKAFRALDGGLNLLDGTGARLLVVVSDGHYNYEEIERARHWLSRCAQTGVGVLWLPFDSGSSASYLSRGLPDVMMVPGTLQPEQAAVEIGRAAAQALTRAGQ